MWMDRSRNAPWEKNDHSAWQEAICFFGSGNMPRIGTCGVRPELRIQVAATRFRVPDVTVLDRAQPTEQIITKPPLVVFEVLSPEDRMHTPQP